MEITFSPMRCDDRLSVHRSGDVLTINGESFDFSPLVEGDTLPREAIDSPWFASDVERFDGSLRMTLVLPHGVGAVHRTLFPTTLTLVTDGPVDIPSYTTDLEADHEEN